jgi:hypothetical protein
MSCKDDNSSGGKKICRYGPVKLLLNNFAIGQSVSWLTFILDFDIWKLGELEVENWEMRKLKLEIGKLKLKFESGVSKLELVTTLPEFYWWPREV